MATINGIPYSSPRNINLKGLTTSKGSTLRFDKTSSSNPLDSSSYGLYVNASGALIFSSAGVSTTIGTAGASVSAPSLDAIFQGDQTLDLGTLSTLTIDRSSGNNDVLTLTNTGGGSGDTLQITNVGTGKDINGTSGTWSFSKVGAGVALTMTLAGTADADSLVLTQGDVSIADGKVALVNQDNEGTLVITNNGLTSAAALSMQGSGTFTGSGASSFFLISPSGLTSGTAMYVVAGALTTGKAIHVVGNAVSSGILVHIASSVATTVLTGAGRLLKVDHTGNATGTGIIAEVNSAAADETVIFKVTASGALALGTALAVSGSGITTGNGITVADLDGLTDGYGVQIASAATAITSTGHLLFVNHTGATTTSGVLSEFKTAATDETVVVKITTAAMINGVALSIAGTTGMTTGSLIRATSSTAAAVATNGVYTFGLTGAFTSTADTLGGFHIPAVATVTGTVFSILGGAMTSGIAAHISDPSTGMTSGSLLRIVTATTGAVATNGIVSIRGTGIRTSTANVGLVDILDSGSTGTSTAFRVKMSSAGQATTEVARVEASGYTTGYSGVVMNVVGVASTGAAVGTHAVLKVTGGNTTGGSTLSVTNNALIAGDSAAVYINHTTSVLGSGNSLLRISSTSTDTGTTTGTCLDIASASTSGHLVLITSSTLTSGDAIKVVLTEGTLNGGHYINFYDTTSSKSVFSVGENGAVLYSDFVETVAATNVITADESGSVFFLSHATEFVSTLPAPAVGLHFTFFVANAPETASYTIVTHDGSDLIHGVAVSAADAGGSVDTTAGTAADTITFVDGQAAIGDYIEVWCDGTNWFAIGACSDEDAITFTAT